MATGLLTMAEKGGPTTKGPGPQSVASHVHRVEFV